MGNRISKIYTATGDDGTTGMASGERVSKSSKIIVAIGSLDEVNAHLGELIALVEDESLQAHLAPLQHLIFNAGGELSMQQGALINTGHVTELEQSIDTLNESLPALKEFVLPGGSVAASKAHVVRAVLRRAEQDLVAAKAESKVNNELLQWVNRCSDLMFVIARHLARNAGGEVLWKNPTR